MKTREYVQVQSGNAAALVLAILAAVMSAAALAVGIIALVRSCSGKRVTAAEYNCFSQSDDDDDEENIGSDTLAF
ncbi:MAG: hypothetical protein K2N26_10230 [Oscillospiraceae bacterium]|nr:hypothetical protein [Oscillospiraceae bacterium]MDE7280085.1 hypothetical protein [Oscillospiraceae bacterium]